MSKPVKAHVIMANVHPDTVVVGSDAFAADTMRGIEDKIRRAKTGRPVFLVRNIPLVEQAIRVVQGRQLYFRDGPDQPWIPVTSPYPSGYSLLAPAEAERQNKELMSDEGKGVNAPN